MVMPLARGHTARRWSDSRAWVSPGAGTGTARSWFSPGPPATWLDFLAGAEVTHLAGCCV